jgi:hypothetical protein
VEPADLERLGGTCEPGACAHPTAAPAETNYKTHGHIHMNEHVQKYRTLQILFTTLQINRIQLSSHLITT